MRIFISYRREDSAGSAGRLHDTLVKQFGPDHVFRDVADIYAGDDFRQAIEREIGQSDVVLVVIGPRWLTVRDDKDRLRPDDLKSLSRRNAVEIRDGAWDDDVRRLVQSIKGARRSWRRQIGAWLSDS